MIKFLMCFLFILILYACKTQVEDNNRNPLLIPEINLNPGGDTNFVSMKYSNISLKINYSENKPKYVLANNILGLNNLRSHYTKNNQGIYFAVSSINQKFISAVGFKYFNGDAGADILIDTVDGTLKNFTNWQDYSNNGQMYNLSNYKNGSITVYNYKNGEIVDSVVFVSRK